MNPSIVKKYENGNQLYFTLTDINVSVANALRRTILADIPVVCIRTETNEINQCKIDVNTSRLHNELVKQRLSCIPIHIRDQELVKKYVIELDVKNDTESVLWVTTEHFKIKDITTTQYLPREKVKEIFPPNDKTMYYIDFLRLRPSIGPTIPGEHIKLSASLSVSTAKENGMFNVASICSYHFTRDVTVMKETWEKIEKQRESEKMEDKDILFEKKNFDALQSYRYFQKNNRNEANSFDFIVQSSSVYENNEIVHLACMILVQKFTDFMKEMEADSVVIYESINTRQHKHSVSDCTIPHSYDIILENEDYTMGCLLEKVLYESYFMGAIEESMTFIGFKKYHPHDNFSVVRIAYKEQPEPFRLKTNVVEACKQIIQTFMKLKNKFPVD